MPRTQIQPVPVNVVGSSTFGRYPKISLEKPIICSFLMNGLLIMPDFKE